MKRLKLLQAEISAAPQSKKHIAPYYMYLGFIEHLDDPVPIARAYAIESLKYRLIPYPARYLQMLWKTRTNIGIWWFGYRATVHIIQTCTRAFNWIFWGERNMVDSTLTALLNISWRCK